MGGNTSIATVPTVLREAGRRAVLTGQQSVGVKNKDDDVRSNSAVGNPSLHYAVKSDSDGTLRASRSAGRALFKKGKGRTNALGLYSG